MRVGIANGFSELKMKKLLIINTLFWSNFKLLFVILGIINADFMAQLLIDSLGIQSLVNAKGVHSKVGAYVVQFLFMIGVTSVIGLISAILMWKDKSIGFYLLALVNTFLGVFFIYFGYNIYPGFERVAIVPTIFILLYGIFAHKILSTK